MTFAITHKKTLTIPDDPAAEAAGLVLPSNWNDTLNAVMASGYLLGRSTAGDGPVQELDATAARALLGITLGAGADNVPVLDGAGKLAASVIPSLALTEPFVVANQAAMLALSAQQGDVAIRTDLNKSFILATNSPSTLGDWKELLTPNDAILSVAGLTGAITAAALRIALGLVVGTDVQAFSALLSQIAALNLSGQNGKVLGVSGGALALVSGGGSVNVQSGYVDTTMTTGGTGEDSSFVNITISAVSSVSKCKPRFVGGIRYNQGNPYDPLARSGSANVFDVIPKLTSTTNLRLSFPYSFAFQVLGRWYVEDNG